MGAFDTNLSEREAASPQPIPIRPTLGDAVPYPIDKMSPRMMSAALAIMDRVQLPDAIAAQSVLAAAALAVQAHIDIQLPTNEVVPTSIFAITVAASGDRKSSGDKLALHAVRLRERDLHNEHAIQQTAFLTDKAAFDAAKKKATTGSKSRSEIRFALEACGKEPTPPVQPVLVTDEGTFPGLQKLFADAMPTLGLFSDEGAQWLGGYSMSADNRGATGAGLSKLWDGAAVKRVRAGEAVTVLYGRRLSLHLMIQPGVAKTLFGDAGLRDQGLMSRILCAQPKTLKGRRFWKEVDDASEPALAEYHSRLENILRLPLPMPDPATRELKPRVVTFSDDAAAMWKAFADMVEGQLGPDGRLDPISGFAAKLPEHAARIAGVMSFFENSKVTEISATALAGGIALAEFYCGEALRLFGMGSTDDDTENAASLIDFIRKKKLTHVGLQWLARSATPASLRPAPVLRRAIQVLVENKHLHAVDGGMTLELGGKSKFYRDAYMVIAEDAE